MQYYNHIIIVYHIFYRNHKQTTTADVKAAHHMEMAAEGHSRNKPLPHDNDMFYRNHRRTTTADAKAAHRLEMAAEGHSRKKPLPRGNDHVYTNEDVPVERNPSYGMMGYS